ncbi:MAG: hypothetical protein JWN11_1593 [Hyphomicrobiales bacterium]|nr:hypothetical protein [Hyphomicrobiales bacterium]
MMIVLGYRVSAMWASECVAAPLPTSPTRGEVLGGDCDVTVPNAQPGTLPPVGRVGEGVSHTLNRQVGPRP